MLSVKIPSSEIPQADVLHEVVKTTKAIFEGAQTFQDIARYIGKVERQGRYYRLAGELLGFIHNSKNNASVTEEGARLIVAADRERIDLLTKAVLENRLFQRVIPFLELYPDGVTRQQLKIFIENVTELVGPSMMGRRVSTVISWLYALDLLSRNKGRYTLSPNLLTRVPLLSYQELSEPLLPRASDLHEYQEVRERTSSASAAIIAMVRSADVERGDNAHRRLVNLVSQRVRRAGVLPRSNHLVDLAIRVNDKPYLFEMKSITANNARSQVRRGLSQLYEYRYLQALPDAILVLVLENALPDSTTWMRRYLEEDRNIRLIWDGNDNLYGIGRDNDSLGFLR